MKNYNPITHTTVLRTIKSHTSNLVLDIVHNPRMAQLKTRYVNVLLREFPDPTVVVSYETLDEIWSRVKGDSKK